MAQTDDTQLGTSELANASHLPEGETSGMDERQRQERRDNAIINEAKDRFTRVQTWEATARQRWMSDYKFANGDADNYFQWPNAIRRSRDVDQRPCLTINKTRQHNLQIINDAKQNKPEIKIRATGNGATAESAKIYQAVLRHIEYKSNAQVAYDVASGFQVHAGKGWLRLTTAYEDNKSFAQEPRISAVRDPLTCYGDPDAKEVDKSDSNWHFAFEDVPKDEFKRTYPKYAQIASAQSIDDSSGWIRDDHVRIAEYFRRVEVPDTLYAIPHQADPTSPPGSPQPEPQVFLASELAQDPEGMKSLLARPGVKDRPTTRRVVEYYLIVGTKIAERSIWPGEFIPFVPVLGEETVIEGQYDCKGHTRALIDAQRIYNYMSSIAVEGASLQTKTPWLAPAEAIEGFETYYEQANKVNAAVLPYNAKGDDGADIPPPQRIEPPVAIPAAIQGMQTAMMEMMMASGQYQDSMGERSNERSAKAINERQRMGSTATYHYIDGLAIAIRAVGRQLLDLIPKLYNAKTVMNILAEDGTSLEVEMDPRLQQAMQQEVAHDGQTIARVLFNPNVGKYEVMADVGPSWGTKRQELVNALGTLITQAPQITTVIGDMLVANLDFDGAEEAAARLRRMVPPQALGLGPSLSEQALQQQVQQLSGLLQDSMTKLTEAQLRLRGKDELREIEVYGKITDRIKVLADASIKSGKAFNPAELDRITEEVMWEAFSTSLEGVSAAVSPTLQEASTSGSAVNGAISRVMDAPPIPGARKGADGHWYVRNYAKSGQFSIVG